LVVIRVSDAVFRKNSQSQQPFWRLRSLTSEVRTIRVVCLCQDCCPKRCFATHFRTLLGYGTQRSK
jgi:hypothetical protein